MATAFKNRPVARVVPLSDAVAELVHDGDELAIEGFSHLVPFEAAHELIRQGRKDLEVIRMVPDILVDQLIGMGCVRRLVFSWAGNPSVGSLHRFRDAVERSWPRPLELEEHTHAGLANRYVAGASGLPFGVLRGYMGTDLVQHTRNVEFVTCPFTSQRLAVVAALHPRVSIVHAQRADGEGNVQLWGVVGMQKEAVLAAERSLVTVEEVVDKLEPVPHSVVLPGWAVTFVALAPGGAQPTYADGYSVRDNEFFARWDEVSRDRATFRDWMQVNVVER